VPPQLYANPDNPTSSQYHDVLHQWSRTAKLYHFLDNKLFVTATFHAQQFRQLFRVAFPDIYGHGGHITQQELVYNSKPVTQHHNFFVAAYTPNPIWNDFEKTDSIWHVTLSSNTGLSVGSDEIKAIKIDENLRIVYPYLGRFDKAYLFRFPQYDKQQQPLLTEHTRSFELKIASALGVLKLKWELMPREGTNIR
jgi:hypothetical protein